MCSDSKKNQCSTEAGAVVVEAAVVLPFFLIVMFITVNVMIFCFHMLRFQYEVADITRQTFILNGESRASVTEATTSPTWRDFLVSQINSRAADIGINTPEPASSSGTEVSFSPTRLSGCQAWNCAASAESGDIFTISITIKEPVFGAKLAGISWQEIAVKLKAIAFVQQPESE
jgi:hypothetical protein